MTQLNDMNTDVEVSLKFAEDAFRTGNLRGARTELMAVLGKEPENQTARLLLANVHIRLSDWEPAKTLFQAVLETAEDNVQALCGLSYINQKTGDFEAAVRYAELATTIFPNDAGILNTLGLAYSSVGRLHDARRALETAVQLAPLSAPLRRNLGEVLERMNLDRAAIQEMITAFKLEPRDLRARLSASSMLATHSRLAQAEAIISETLNLFPDDVRVLLQAGYLAGRRGESRIADEQFMKAVVQNPGARVPYSAWLLEQGRKEDAERELIQYRAMFPEDVAALGLLAQARSINSRSDPLVEELQTLLTNPSLPLADRSALLFAFAAILDRTKNYGEAMAALDEANEIAFNLHFRTSPNLKATIEDEVDRLISAFTSEEVVNRSRAGNPSSRPIFIVGMMRSGTTLLERMVSNHPRVTGAGELLFWLDHLDEAVNHPELSDRLAQQYLDLLDDVAPGSEFVTDKAPPNSRLIGAIHCALPNAKFIAIRRNAIDTAISLYMMSHRKPPPFAYSKANIAFGYKQHLRMMDHWAKVVPANRLHQVTYEGLVENPESTLREILEFLEVDWNELCLHPEKNDSAIRTHSLVQARQPIYRSSLQRWKNYEPWLGDLNDLRGL